MGTTIANAAMMYSGSADGIMAAALAGSADAYFELGIAFSTGTDGREVNLIEAHKWFNLAALSGVEEGASLRSEVAEDMSREEISEAQKQARAWLVAMKTGTLTPRIARAA